MISSELLVHGFLKVGDTKMGKSNANAIDPFAQVAKYGVDTFRFYLLGTLPIDGDGEFSVQAEFLLRNNEQGFEDKINGELVANFSNLCFRAMSLIHKTLGGKIETFNKSDPIIAEITPKFQTVTDFFEKREFNRLLGY